MDQPNATHDGDAALSTRFWFALVLTGVLAGLFGVALMWILAQVEHLVFHTQQYATYQDAVRASSHLRRVTSLVVAGLIGGISWYLIRRILKDEKSEIDESVWNGTGELSLRRSSLTAIVSEIVVGMGASVGREAAPKTMGGVSGSLTALWFKLSPAQRRLLVACGGGAGFAAVYNVPLGGALFTAEVLMGSLALPTVLPALAATSIATAVAWIYLPDHATYVDIPNYRFSGTLMGFSLVAGVVVGVLAVLYVRMIAWVSFHRTKGVALVWVMPLSFAVLGVIGIWYPELFGNGIDIAHEAFLGVGATTLFLVIFALKPLVTALCLRSGAAGGLFTPFLATGAVFGAFAGSLWLHAWPGSPVGAFAIVGAAAMIGASMQAPLAGVVIVMELTHSGFTITLPMLVATVIATTLVRHIDGYSIYSARLPAAERS